MPTGGHYDEMSLGCTVTLLYDLLPVLIKRKKK